METLATLTILKRTRKYHRRRGSNRRFPAKEVKEHISEILLCKMYVCTSTVS